MFYKGVGTTEPPFSLQVVFCDELWLPNLFSCFIWGLVFLRRGLPVCPWLIPNSRSASLILPSARTRDHATTVCVSFILPCLRKRTASTLRSYKATEHLKANTWLLSPTRSFTGIWHVQERIASGFWEGSPMQRGCALTTNSRTKNLMVSEMESWSGFWWRQKDYGFEPSLNHTMRLYLNKYIHNKRICFYIFILRAWGFCLPVYMFPVCMPGYLGNQKRVSDSLGL